MLDDVKTWSERDLNFKLLSFNVSKKHFNEAFYR